MGIDGHLPGPKRGDSGFKRRRFLAASVSSEWTRSILVTPWPAKQAAARVGPLRGEGVFVGLDLRVGEPGVLSDRGVNVDVSDAATADLFAAAMGSPTANVRGPAKPRYIDVDHIAGLLVLLAVRGCLAARITAPVTGSDHTDGGALWRCRFRGSS